MTSKSICGKNTVSGDEASDASAFTLNKDILEDTSPPEEEVVFDDEILFLGDVDEANQEEDIEDHHRVPTIGASAPLSKFSASSVPSMVDVVSSKSPPPSLTKSTMSGAITPDETITGRLSADDEDEQHGDDPSNPSSLEEGESASFQSGSHQVFGRKLEFSDGRDNGQGHRELTQKQGQGEEGSSLPSSSTASIHKHPQRSRQQRKKESSSPGSKSKTTTTNGAIYRRWSPCRAITCTLLGLVLSVTAGLIAYDPTLPVRTTTFLRALPLAGEYKTRMEVAESDLRDVLQETSRLQAEASAAAARADEDRLRAQIATAKRNEAHQEQIETLQSQLGAVQEVVSTLQQEVLGVTRSKEAAELKVREQLEQINDLMQQWNSERANRLAVEMENGHIFARAKEQDMQVLDLVVRLEEAEDNHKKEELARQEVERQLAEVKQQQLQSEAATISLRDVGGNEENKRLMLVQERQREEAVRRWEKELAERMENEERRIMEELMRVKGEKYAELSLELEREHEVQKRNMLEQLMLARKEQEESLARELERHRSEEERCTLKDLQILRAEKEEEGLKHGEGGFIDFPLALHRLRVKDNILSASAMIANVKIQTEQSVLLRRGWKEGDPITPQIFIKVKDAASSIARASKAHKSKLVDLGSKGIRACDEATERIKQSLVRSPTVIQMVDRVMRARGLIESRVVYASSRISKTPMTSSEVVLLKGFWHEAGPAGPNSFGRMNEAASFVLARSKKELDHLGRLTSSGYRSCSMSTKVLLKLFVRDSKEVADQARGKAKQLGAVGMGKLVRGKESILRISSIVTLEVSSFSTIALRSTNQWRKLSVQNILNIFLEVKQQSAKAMDFARGSLHSFHGRTKIYGDRFRQWGFLARGDFQDFLQNSWKVGARKSAALRHQGTGFLSRFRVLAQRTSHDGIIRCRNLTAPVTTALSDGLLSAMRRRMNARQNALEGLKRCWQFGVVEATNRISNVHSAWKNILRLSQAIPSPTLGDDTPQPGTLFLDRKDKIHVEGKTMGHTGAIQEVDTVDT